MPATQHPVHKLGFLLGSAILGALAGCTTNVVERPAPVYVAPEPPAVYAAPAPVVVETPVAPEVVVIQAEADFYEPLAPYGRWVEVPGYGRCFVPGGVAADWRPYANGHWEHTEAGWFWVSDEPWAWATYHYGRWDSSPEFGWYWIPQTQWAPAWVAWRRGGGYTGWAPLPPPRLERGARVEVDVNAIAPRSYVFVEERHFTEAHRPATVIINNTQIVNQTVIINNTTVVNRTVVNAGPAVADIERSTGRAVPVAAGKDLRGVAEAPVAARHPAVPSRQVATPDKTAPKPVENVRGKPEAPAKPGVTETNLPKPPASAPAHASTPPPASSKPAPSKPSPVRPVSTPANPKPGVTQTNAPKPPASVPIHASTPSKPASSKPAPVRPVTTPANPKPGVTVTNAPKPSPNTPARAPTPSKPTPARSVSPPAKPAAPENPGTKPAPNDEKKKPDQP